ncbi:MULTISPECIES: LacI family DNA-binding transcriptional regulator [unclassified Rhizobium]|uniref:LacI family DNA-binding transcriptional regulator n=1 Tax=unclassified Rhizobium TaxID=2613769 RepID=UPI001ADA9197|nr:MULTISPECIES: LacI family DNA-binding transcriptional regulator [unclassified Rhizobium]MBO9127900.1 LacI family DNA-binding transcriptional regulator [Rhizobium sp. 16-488-2b]MBO9178294.1 LacI family DNA-binding transcriptional regulator [Rhizobium sp. 16-488-2a]
MVERKKVTIKDVAKASGLALSTVSNALSGKNYVKEETRKLVDETARKLGYRASAVARALRMQRSFTIGVLIADVANPSSADFVRGVEDVAIREKCTMLLCNTDEDEERQILQMQTLYDRQVDGMVLISQHCESPRIRALLDGGTPYVLVQRRSSKWKDDYVGSDNQEGLAEAIRHAHALGHRRVGFVTGPLESSSARERLETFKQESARLKLSQSKSMIFEGRYTFDSGLAAGKYFTGMKNRPTCVLASSDMNALGFMQVALEEGLRIPQDVSVIGLDDISLAGLKSINLTTIQLQKRDMGAAAAELLMKRIRKPAKVGKPIILPTRLIIRGTTASPVAGGGKPDGN